jgi:hypothetical protein
LKEGGDSKRFRFGLLRDEQEEEEKDVHGVQGTGEFLPKKDL